MNGIAGLVAPMLPVGALILSRVAAFVALSPFPSNFASTTPRIGLAVIVTLSLIYSVDISHVPTSIDGTLALGVLREVLCGSLMGFSLRLLLLAADALGTSISVSMGLSMPGVFDPNTESQETPISHIMTLLGMFVAIGAGVHRTALGHLLRSFDAIPLGAPQLNALSAPFVLELASNSLVAGVRLSMPIAAVCLVVQMALALVARSAPQLQLFNVGLGVLFATGLVATATSLNDITMGLGEYFQRVDGTFEQVVMLLGPKAP